MDPQTAHELISKIGQNLGKFDLSKRVIQALFGFKNPTLNQNVHGISFTNPVGLSEGYDKDGKMAEIIPYVGFGFMQIGSVTLNPYEGNAKPWLTRLVKSKAIIVNYGLKSAGVKKIIQNLKTSKLKPDFPISVSVAKTNAKYTNCVEDGVKDYVLCLKELVSQNIGDFYTINISCPNTFGGEPFTNTQSFDILAQEITTLNIQKPIFVKMPINLPWNDFKSICETCIKNNFAGVIIGNLQKDRTNPDILDQIPADRPGGISGKPTFKTSNELISRTYQEFGNKLTIIGVGGIFSAQDAYEKIKRGASLVQLITGMIYEGPQLIGDINRGLVALLKADGYTNISQAVGTHNGQ